MKCFIFEMYSWLTSIGWRILDCFPQFIRKLFFKVFMKQFGKRSFIDYTSYMRYMRQIKIGSGVAVNRGCKFFASHFYKNVYITIGDNTAIGPDVTVFAAGHDYKKLNLPDTADSVIIGNNCWIGGRSTILQGVKIGDGAVVAAGSIVTHDVQPFTIVAGVPAKEIKKRELISDMCCD